MKTIDPPPQGDRKYINVMESLVAQEVGKQLQTVPARVRRYLKMEEVVTYALNRLPTLYACSERGWRYQQQLAKRDMQRKIGDAVRQAIAAVQADPLRRSQPIALSRNSDAEGVLQALKDLLQIPDLTWSTAISKLQDLQKDASLVSVLRPQPTAWRPDLNRQPVGWSPQEARKVSCASSAGSEPQ